jgi:hypothetical protein
MQILLEVQVYYYSKHSLKVFEGVLAIVYTQNPLSCAGLAMRVLNSTILPVLAERNEAVISDMTELPVLPALASRRNLFREHTAPDKSPYKLPDKSSRTRPRPHILNIRLIQAGV